MGEKAESTKSQQENLKLTITLQGKEGAIGIRKNVIKVLDAPRFVALRISYKNNSLLLIPCEQQDVMSYEIPHNFLKGRHVNFRIHSLSFVKELLEYNELDSDTTYILEGAYASQMNAVVFPLETAKLMTESDSSGEE
jgi:hypothetical protein